MVYRHDVMVRIAAVRVVAIVRADSAGTAEQVGRAVLDGGLDVVEVALTTPDGLEALRVLAADAPDAVLGAGTVLDAATARLAILAGARFIVSPGLHPGVVETAHRYGAAVLPGAQTPTEVERALSAGADAVKVFPAAQLGPGWLSAVRAALPHAPLVPTGGITPDTAGQWLDAGALAVGVGGALTAGGDTDVTARTRALLDDLGRAG
jgi:2-dehydro-3-deoxyphosphogluconate aldolase / (4S)-4-hydroxy-2-oxoglutarate aldolase